MSDSGQTRRRLFQTGAGAAAGLALTQLGPLGLPFAQAQGNERRELRLFAGDYVPVGWSAFGDGKGRALLGAGDSPDGPARRVGDSGKALARGGKGDGPATLGLTYILGDKGHSPDALIGEVRVFAFDTKLKDWLDCNGDAVRIGSNTALFTVLGTDFGGDGQSTFKLPDLRGRTPLGNGDAAGLPPVKNGEPGDGLAKAGDGRPVRLHFNLRICARGDYPQRPER
jgi:hypothetical protein